MEQIQKSWYDKWYKILFILPILLTVICLVYLASFYAQHDDFIYRDVTLSGGTTITLNSPIDTAKLESALNSQFPDIATRKLTDIRTGKAIAVIIESSASPEELKPAVEKFLGYTLTDANSSIEFTGPTLSQSFYKELIKMVFISFILMGVVIFFIFGESKLIKAVSLVLSFSAVRLTFPKSSSITLLVIAIGIISILYALIKARKTKTDYYFIALAALVLATVVIFPVYNLIWIIALILIGLYFIASLPSIAVIFAAFSDIVMTLTVVNLLGIKLSSAGIAAFLMLIGYSVDTDILLTSRALQKEHTLNHRIYGAFKTGILMNLTALGAVLPAFFIVSGLPDSFRQIFLILAIGQVADIINTWLTNASIIKWYGKRKGMQ